MTGSSGSAVARHYSILFLFAGALLLLLAGGCAQRKNVDPTIPVIQLSTHNLHFVANAKGDPSAVQEVIITNGGEGRFVFQTRHTSDWLLVNTTGIAPDTMILAAAPLLSMRSGQYTDTLVISADNASNSPQTIVITFLIHESLGLIPPALHFDMPTGGPVPVPETIAVLSNGGGLLHYSSAISNSWLRFSADSGHTPSSIVASIDTTGLPSGTYAQTVLFASPEAFNSPVAMACSLQVAPWYQERVGTANNLHGIFFRDSLHGIAVGFIPNEPERIGIIFGSDDGGMSWTELVRDPATEIGGLDFLDNSHGCAVATRGHTYVTDDGGRTWQRNVGDSTLSFWKVKLLSSDIGWAVGPKGALAKTVNGGRTWARRIIPGVDSLPLGNLFFQNQATGWIVGNGGLLLYTFDGGESWTRLRDPIFESTDLWGITFKGNSGWIAGTGGKVFHTANGGTTWSRQSTPTTVRLDVVRFVNEAAGWIVGDQGTILHTENSGATWEAQDSGVSEHLFDLFMLSERHGLAVGEFRLLLSTYNGGG